MLNFRYHWYVRKSCGMRNFKSAQALQAILFKLPKETKRKKPHSLVNGLYLQKVQYAW